MVLSARKVYNCHLGFVFNPKYTRGNTASFGKDAALRKDEVMKKNLTAIVLAVIMMLSMAGCSSSGPVGYWQIDEVSAGEVVMTQEDANSLGIATVGSVKLQKSGACVVTMLGEESEGTWTQAEDGTLTVTYGDDLVLTGSIDDEGVMTLEDAQGSVYTLSK